MAFEGAASYVTAALMVDDEQKAGPGARFGPNAATTAHKSQSSCSNIPFATFVIFILINTTFQLHAFETFVMKTAIDRNGARRVKSARVVASF
jgi:hypothetical protein